LYLCRYANFKAAIYQRLIPLSFFTSSFIRFAFSSFSFFINQYDLENNRAAKRCRYQQDLKYNRAAKHHRYQQDLEDNRAKYVYRYKRDAENNRAKKRTFFYLKNVQHERNS